MGFPHDKTTHHFRLAENGGSIEVTANDPKDSANIDAIRMHLGHIAKAFGEGDFSTPMLVHDMIPPGVTTMKLLKEKIHFELPGGRQRRQMSALQATTLLRALQFTTFYVSRSPTMGQAIPSISAPESEKAGQSACRKMKRTLLLEGVHSSTRKSPRIPWPSPTPTHLVST